MNAIKNLFSADVERLKQHWLALVAAFVAFLIGSLSILDVITNDRHGDRLAVTASLFISIAIAARISTKSARAYAAVAIAGFGALALFAYFNVDSRYFFERFFQLAVMTHLWIAIAPAVRNRFSDEIATGRFNWFLFVRIEMVAIQSGLLLGGLLLALGSLDFLFGIKVESTAYKILSLFIFYNVSCFLLVSALDVALDVAPDGATGVAPSQNDHAKLLRLLIKNVFTPLSVLYFAILYIYAIEIVALREWPHGKVGWLVSGLSVMVTLTFLIKRPFEKQNQLAKWIETFWRLSFALLVPLLFLLFGAVYRRVDEYGWTEERIALAILTVWMLGIAVYYIRPDRRTIHAIPVSLLIVCAIFWMGPVSLQSLAYRSQTTELRKAVQLREHDRSLVVTNHIYEVIRYICEKHGPERLGGALALAGKDPGDDWLDTFSDTHDDCYSRVATGPVSRAALTLGIKQDPDERPINTETFEFGDASESTAYKVGGAYIAAYDVHSFDAPTTNEGGLRFWIKPHDNAFLEWKLEDGLSHEIDLRDVMKHLKAIDVKGRHAVVDSRNLYETKTADGTMKLRFKSFRVGYNDEHFSVNDLKFIAFFTPTTKKR